MPRYTYHCEDCDEYIEVSHGMTERPQLKCECEAILVKALSVPLSLKVKKVDDRIGAVVKSSIEEFKKDLKEQRDEATKKEI
jgi:putative FmdB family regulatory protein